MSFPSLIKLGATLLAGVLLFTAPPTLARTLRVCADPNNLPYSNERQEGFENRIAEIIAADLKAELQYTWWTQREGFLGYTVDAGTCDVVMGVPQGFAKLATTHPYYRSSYMFVTRSDRRLGITSLDDPRLRALRVGVQLVTDEASTPPAHALADRGITNNVRGFVVVGDYGTPAPTAPIVDAVARGDVDVAMVWGPQAGYFAQHEPVALALAPIALETNNPARPMQFDISIGVRGGDDAFRHELDEVLKRHRSEIDRVLADYGVPRFERPHAPSGGAK